MENNIMKDLKATLTRLGITHFEAGVYTDKDLPDSYIVVIPTGDTFLAADDNYINAAEAARLYIYSRGAIATSVYELKDRVVLGLMAEGYAVSDSRYDGFNSDIQYHTWSVAAEKAYVINYTNTED